MLPLFQNYQAQTVPNMLLNPNLFMGIRPPITYYYTPQNLSTL